MSMIDIKSWLQQQPYECRPSSPCLFILMGLSGSGKSTVSQFLTNQYNAAWISSDIERQQQYDGRDDMYSSAVTGKLFEYMASMANQLLQEKYPVIIDSCALTQEERDWFRQAADNIHCPVILIFCQAPEDQLKERIRLRLQLENNPSQAQPELIDSQRQWIEQPSNKERRSLINLNTSLNDWQTTLAEELNRQL